jgi:DNA-binding XRE family transcriptional regulator
MRKKDRQRKWVDPEDFWTTRKRAGLTREMAADMLDVEPRTLRNWEEGCSRIPYTAYKVLRMTAGYLIPFKAWDDWFIKGTTLVSPEGRTFEQHELRYISRYISISRIWLKEQEARHMAGSNRHVSGENPLNATAVAGSASGLPSPSYARRSPCDAAPCHDAVVEVSPQLGLQESGSVGSFTNRTYLPAHCLLEAANEEIYECVK